MPNWFPAVHRRQQIIAISVPILSGMVSQNILNLIDAAMVGHLGSAALGAVGISSFLNFLLVAIFLGLATGVQVMVARRLGEGNQSKAAAPLNGSLLINLLFAVPVSIALFFAVPTIVNVLMVDPAVIVQGEMYLEMRVLGIWAIAMNFAFRGFWSGIKLTKYYMYVLIGTHVLNVFLNYALIYGNFGFPEMGVQGAGLGTTLSMITGTIIHFVLCLNKARGYGFMERLPSMKALRDIVRLSIPNSIQQFFFAAGFSALFLIISHVSTDALAAANVITNITLVAILLCIAFGMSASTLVSEALGRGDVDDAYRWGWDVSVITMLFISIISVIFLVFNEHILAVFLVEPAALEAAITPLQIVAIGLPLEALGMVMMHALIGAGATKASMKVSMVLQWLIFLPVAWLLGPGLGMGLTAIWFAQIGYRSAQAVIFVIMWRKQAWQHLNV